MNAIVLRAWAERGIMNLCVAALVADDRCSRVIEGGAFGPSLRSKKISDDPAASWPGKYPTSGCRVIRPVNGSLPEPKALLLGSERTCGCGRCSSVLHPTWVSHIRWGAT